MWKPLFLALIVCGSMAIGIDQSELPAFSQQLLEKVKNTEWGQIILTMSEVSSSTEGILKDLIDTIQQLINELTDNLVQLEKDYQRTQSTYNTKKQQLQQQSEDASKDIFNASDMINSVLFPMRDNLQKRLKQVGEFIDDNRKNLLEETLQRNKAHANFVERVNNHQEAIGGVDECISLLQGITNTGSFAQVQVNRFQTQIQNIERKVSNKETLGPLIKVIMELASQQNFSDQGLVKQLIDQFNKLRVELVDSLNQEQADEATTQKLFEERVKSLGSEYVELQRQAKEATYQLATIETKLDNYTIYLLQRQNDLQSIQAQQQENENWYAQETDIYNNLKSQYLRQKEASEQALALVSNPDFVNYIKSKGQL